MIGNFHFIRPWALLALIPAVLVWWLLRRRTDAAQPWHGIIAPHLLPFLLGGEEKRARFGPLKLAAIGSALAVLAIAGPTWRQEPAPFADDTAALAIVVKVAPSMKTEDLPPDRLARATEKIHDLLAIRAGARTALIAYAGTAHLVMPTTTDGGIINTFAAALDPKVMPTEGDAASAAFRLADQTLKDAGNGSILWITDSVAPEQSSDLATWRKASRTPVQLLPPLLPGPELDALKSRASVVEAALVRVTADDADVYALARSAKFSAVATGQLSDRWQESGYWLTPLLAAAVLPFFRRGWMISSGGNV